MTWVKGQSGNKNGRPKGALNKRTALIKALESEFSDGEQEFWKHVVSLAKSGDMSAVNAIASRLYPALKPITPSAVFELDNTSPSTQARSVLSAIANGELSADVGKGLIDSIHSVMKIVQVDELLERINKLEKAVENEPR